MKSKKGSSKVPRDARGRFAKNLAFWRANEGSSTKKGEVGGAQKTIYMPIQASNGKTAEAIVIKNDESAKNKADVTDVKIVEK